MPCYRCGARQVDPEPGKPSPWHRGVAREHQVLICPGCYPGALAELSRCSRCDGVRLVRQLDQIECLDCRLTREAGSDLVVPLARREDLGLAAEVASALARVLGRGTRQSAAAGNQAGQAAGSGGTAFARTTDA